MHAARIHPHFVQGLNTNWQQMVYLDDATNKGLFGALIQSRDSAQGTQLLQFDLKALRPFFKTVLDSLPRYSLTHTQVVSKLQPPSTLPLIAQTPNSVEQLSMYPNPATDQVTLNFATLGGWTTQLYALDGHLLHRQQVQASSLVLSLAQLPPGGYLVKLTEDSTGHVTTKRLLVQR